MNLDLFEALQSSTRCSVSEPVALGQTADKTGENQSEEQQKEKERNSLNIKYEH